MKKMKIEKQLIFADHVNKVLALQVNEGLTYKHEDDGIRALGPLYIVGQYEGNEGMESFQETLEMDVFAPTDKLSGSDFRLEIADYQANAVDGGVQLLIALNIHGLKENSTSKATEAPIQAQEEPSTPQPYIVPTIAKPVTVAPTITESTSEIVSEEVSEKTSVDDFNDLFSDAESTYTSYRIVVAKQGDSYEAISQRYDVDEIALRNTNKNKDVLAKTLVILPFVQK